MTWSAWSLDSHARMIVPTRMCMDAASTSKDLCLGDARKGRDCTRVESPLLRQESSDGEEEEKEEEMWTDWCI